MGRRPAADLTPGMVAGYTARTLSSYDIARALGCSQPTALKRLREAGVDTSANPGREPRVVVPPEWVRAYLRREAGIADVAAALGCSYGGARKALRRAGEVYDRSLPPIDPAGRAEARDAARRLGKLLRWLGRRGYTHATLARVLGVSPRTVTDLRRK